MSDQEKQQTTRPLVSDEDKDIPFADLTQATTNPEAGIILSFAQFRPHTGSNHVIGQVMLPTKVAAETVMMLLGQIAVAEKTTGRKFLPESMRIIKQPNQTSD